jgi:hypothetical protein
MPIVVVIVRHISQLSGGRAINDHFQSHVALIEFGDDFLASQTQVYYVYLLSLDLTNITRRLSALLPVSLYGLYLDNTLQYEFPTYLADAFPSLQYLYVVVMRSSWVA